MTLHFVVVVLIEKKRMFPTHLTGICGNVMVTSSPFPTCNSPSQLVSIEAGLKSSEVHKTNMKTGFETVAPCSVWKIACTFVDVSFFLHLSEY